MTYRRTDEFNIYKIKHSSNDNGIGVRDETNKISEQTRIVPRRIPTASCCFWSTARERISVYVFSERVYFGHYEFRFFFFSSSIEFAAIVRNNIIFTSNSFRNNGSSRRARRGYRTRSEIIDIASRRSVIHKYHLSGGKYREPNSFERRRNDLLAFRSVKFSFWYRF